MRVEPAPNTEAVASQIFTGTLRISFVLFVIYMLQFAYAWSRAASIQATFVAGRMFNLHLLQISVASRMDAFVFYSRP